MSPGTVTHIGTPRSVAPKATIYQFNSEQCREWQIAEIAELEQIERPPSTVTWIDIDGVHEPAWLEKVGALFQIHPLVLEDIANTTTRPKFEEYDSFIFVSLKSFELPHAHRPITSEQISVVFGGDWVVSFQERPGDTYNGIRSRLREGGLGRLRKMGADYLAYRIVDSIVDHYFSVLEEAGELVERTEQSIVRKPSEEALRALYHWKRSFLDFRRAMWPLREAMSSWERIDSPLVAPESRLFVRDTYGHTIEVIDIVETHREMISSALELYLSSVSNRMNSVIVVLTLMTAIFMPLTFIAGVYGMNFEFMPELHWRYGYPLVLAVMAMVVVSMLTWFKRRGWL